MVAWNQARVEFPRAAAAHGAMDSRPRCPAPAVAMPYTEVARGPPRAAGCPASIRLSYPRFATLLTLAFHMTLGRQCPPAQVAANIHPKTEDRK